MLQRSLRYGQRHFLALILVLLCSACSSLAVVESGRLELGATSLAYDVQGSGPAVVLLQGAQVGRGLWDAEFERLAEDYSVIRYDVRGFGESGPEAEPFLHHEDLLRLLDYLAVERAHLIGLSLGGRIAIDTALENPERVRSLVLAGPGLSGFAWSDDGSWDAIQAAIDAGDVPGAADRWLEHPYMAPAMEQEELRERLRALARANAQVWFQRAQEVELDPPALGRLGELRLPVLVLIGSRDVADIHAIVDLIERDVPQAERVDFPGAGHVLNLERPARFQEVVLGFLARAGDRR